jgi:hypothetical protein
MSKRLTQLDRAIQNLTAEIATLQLARQRLIEQKQQQEKPKPTLLDTDDPNDKEPR